MKRCVVAVSGGVDSVVLLDMLARQMVSPSGSLSSWRTEESGAVRPESSGAPAQIVNDKLPPADATKLSVDLKSHGLPGNELRDRKESWSSESLGSPRVNTPPSWHTVESRASLLESSDAPASIINGGALAPGAQRENRGDFDFIVAHFDHGIRPDSAEDAQFVKDLAGRYGLIFETEREELGADVSEALARERRYAFLRRVAKKHQAVIATAHHMNDVAETVAINLSRGTGWRGLAVLAGEVWRPLLSFTKQDLVDYARQHHLEWREDSTNLSDAYLRNRLRQRLTNQDTVLQLAALRSQQLDLRRQIESLLEQFAPEEPFSRQFFAGLEEPLAQEFLRYVTKGRLTRPQLERALEAIRTFRPGSIHQPGGGCELHFSSRYFTMQML